MLATQPGKCFFFCFFLAYALGRNYVNEEYLDVHIPRRRLKTTVDFVTLQTFLCSNSNTLHKKGIIGP